MCSAAIICGAVARIGHGNIILVRRLRKDGAPSTRMSEQNLRVYWEKESPKWWSSCIGYVMEEGGQWAGYVYHNSRRGESWTERKPGFRTAQVAKRWVEDNAEE